MRDYTGDANDPRRWAGWTGVPTRARDEAQHVSDDHLDRIGRKDMRDQFHFDYQIRGGRQVLIETGAKS